MRLKKKEGVILLQNRRGFSAFVECPSCGFVEMCRNCSLSLTYHKPKYLLRCHYCGFSKKLPLVCEKCGSPASLYKGAGTQRVEEELQALFPAAKIVRMDFDTTTKKGAHEKILSLFGNKEIDVLLGTQMVAKGLDFPHVTLVGVINADLQMLLPDFRAAERTFQLLTQVAGRAGRSSLAGEVVIQTYQPEHYCLNFVTQHDSVGFFNVELFHRRQLLYPPFSRIAVVEFKGRDEHETLLTAQVFARFLKHLNGTVSVLGPSPAAIEKIQNYYRFHILLKSDKEKDKSGNYLHTVLRNAIEEFKQTPYGKSRKVVFHIDIDPGGMM
jgi:primosomal protein N' (replication factor Y)